VPVVIWRTGAPERPRRFASLSVARSPTRAATRWRDWRRRRVSSRSENVGNLVCPASYDLGERLRVVLLSVTEGEDKPLKYPTIFNGADLALITKIDLAAAVGFDRAEALKNLREVRPGLEVIETSSRTGAGMEAWLERLRAACPA
jgi:hypothetical protein